ncbi:hypothetical protein ACFV4Q_36365 [Streptomyces nojiriensis]
MWEIGAGLEQLLYQVRQQARFDKMSPTRRLYTPPGELKRRR